MVGLWKFARDRCVFLTNRRSLAPPREIYTTDRSGVTAGRGDTAAKVLR